MSPAARNARRASPIRCAPAPLRRWQWRHLAGLLEVVAQATHQRQSTKKPREERLQPDETEHRDAECAKRRVTQHADDIGPDVGDEAVGRIADRRRSARAAAPGSARTVSAQISA